MISSDAEPSRTHYRFVISLRVRHPTMDPKRITATLRKSPEHSGKAGDPRTTPKARPLEGRNAETRWTTRLFEGSYPTSLDGSIHDVLNDLTGYRTFLHEIRGGGGSVELIVAWFFDHQSGETVSHACLALAGDLQIDLALYVYPPDVIEPPDEA